MSNDSNALKYIGIGCVIAAVLACCCCGGIAAFFGMQWAGPLQATQGFFDDVKAQRYPAALHRMSQSYQSSHDAAAFTEAVHAIPELEQQTNVQPTQFNVVNGSATIGGALTTPKGPVPFELSLSQTGTFWYIDRVTIGDTTLQ